MSHKRCVAQLGRALRSGRRGRRFKSCRIDYKKTDTARYLFFYNQNERTGSVTSSVPNARSDRPERSVDRRFKGICFFVVKCKQIGETCRCKYRFRMQSLKRKNRYGRKMEAGRLGI